MKLSDFYRTQVTQYLIEVDRTIYYCGMHTHIYQSSVEDVANTSKKLNLALATNFIQTGSITVAILTDIQPNQIPIRSVTLAGSVTNEGKYTGAQYSDNYGTWSDVVV